MINQHFSRVHASFWLGIEQCSNRRRNLHSTRRIRSQICMTHVPETGAGKMESIFGAGFWSVCHGYKSCWWVGALRCNLVCLSVCLSELECQFISQSNGIALYSSAVLSRSFR